MSSEKPEELCRALGLDPQALGEAEVLVAPQDPVANALAGVDRVSFDIGTETLAEEMSKRPWRPWFSDQAAMFGVEILRDEDDDRRVQLASTSGAPLSVRSVGGAGTFVDGEVVYVDFSAARGAVVATEEGEQIVLNMVGRNLLVWPVLGQTLKVEPLVGVVAPLSEWLADSDDAWLVRHLETAVQSESAWSQASAAGTIARLESIAPARVSSVIQQLLQGAADEREHRVWDWAVALSVAQRQTLLDLLGAEVSMVQSLLDELESSVAPDDDSWLATLSEVLHRRDDVESVAGLLAHAGDAAAVADLVAPLDARGEVFVRALPPLAGLRDDERLRRAAVATTDAWWVYPVSW